MIEVDGQTIHEIQRQTHDEIRYKSKKVKWIIKYIKIKNSMLNKMYVKMHY